MNERKPEMFIPALIGGAVAGVASGIPLLNCLCCLWVIGGGMLAAYVLQKDSLFPLTAGDGAIVGVFSGIIAAVVEFLVSIPLTPLNRIFFTNLMERMAEFSDKMPSGWESWIEKGGIETSLAAALFGLFVNTITFSLLGLLGGVIGISIFKKKKTPEIVNIPKDSIRTKNSDNSQS